MTLSTITQAAEIAQISTDTIMRRIRDGRLKAIQFGGGKRPAWRIEPASLLACEPVSYLPAF